MTEAKRRAILYVALAGVVAWSLWLGVGERNEGLVDRNDVAEPAAHVPHRAAAPRPPAAAAYQTRSIEAEPRLGPSRADLFPEQTWYVPPPPPPHVPPPPPQAPALPFAYMGEWQEAGQTTYYLTRGTQPVSVRTGQVLDGVWRLESAAGGVLNFTYLPLNQTRSLRTGD